MTDTDTLVANLPVDLTKVLTNDQLLQCYRRHNIRAFLGSTGHTQVSISKGLGYSNSTFLGQMVGAYPIRPISEKTVRKIEDTFGLDRYTLDAPCEITIDDLFEPDRKFLDPEYQMGEGYLLNKRKHARTDYSKFAKQDFFGIRYAGDSTYSEVIVKADDQPPLPIPPTFNESTLIELIDLIESSELSSGKALKVLKMSIKDIFKKQTLDREFVANLIELSK